MCVIGTGKGSNLSFSFSFSIFSFFQFDQYKYITNMSSSEHKHRINNIFFLLRMKGINAQKRKPARSPAARPNSHVEEIEEKTNPAQPYSPIKMMKPE